jgi:hypothetical protein
MLTPAVTFRKTDQQQRQFPIKPWAGILGGCLIDPHILPARVNCGDHRKFLQTQLTAGRSILHFATCGFITTLIHHLSVVKCVSGCPIIILDSGLVAEVELQFPGLHAHLTWVLLILSVDVFGNQCLCQYSRCYRGTVTSNSAISKWNKDFTQNLGTFASLFSCRTELCVREHGGHLKRLL